MPIANIKVQNQGAAESRLADVEAARVLTEFIRCHVLSESEALLSAQVKSLSRLALTLLG